MEYTMIETVFKYVKRLDGKVLEGWSQSATNNGVLYYINHDLAITQWDHPDYIRLLDDILQFNNVKFAAYRTACKFRMLQKALKFDKTSLHCVISAFDVAGLRFADNKALISIQKIKSILLYILNATHKCAYSDFSVVVDIILNIMLNTFDEDRSGKLDVLQCKIILAVLSGGRLQEKFRYIFSQVANRNNCCTKKKLAQILHIISAIPEILSEQLSFGESYVPAAVASCFKEVRESEEAGVPEDYFLNWLLQEPQSLVWWSTAYRLSVSEMVCHDVKCSVCKQYPCVGLRYQCLHCLSYNLCQDCFLHGHTSKSHKMTHPIQEYCHESSAKEWRKSVMKLFRHRLKISRHFKPRYLSLAQQSVGLHLSSLLQESMDNSSTNTETEAVDKFPCKTKQEIILQALCKSVETIDQFDLHLENNDKEIGLFSDPNVTPLSSTELIHSVIVHLRDAHRFLCERLENCSSTQENLPGVLKDHISKLQAQIQKLQSVLKNDNSNCFLHSKRKTTHFKNELPRMESTPIVGDRGLHLSFSPIGTEIHNDSAVLDNKENHNVEKKCFSNVITSTRQGSNEEFETMSEKKILSNISENLVNSCHDISVRPKVFKRFPSFSELSLMDLTSTSSIASSGTPISNNNIYKEFQEELRRMKMVDTDHTVVENLKKDLDAQLQIFESMFPIILKVTLGMMHYSDLHVRSEKLSECCRKNKVKPQKGKDKVKLPDEIITTANEVGDVIVSYIETLSIGQIVTAF